MTKNIQQISALLTNALTTHQRISPSKKLTEEEIRLKKTCVDGITKLKQPLPSSSGQWSVFLGICNYYLEIAEKQQEHEVARNLTGFIRAALLSAFEIRAEITPQQQYRRLSIAEQIALWSATQREMISIPNEKLKSSIDNLKKELQGQPPVAFTGPAFKLEEEKPEQRVKFGRR